jgi:predicted hydrocarbon binding protein
MKKTRKNAFLIIAGIIAILFIGSFTVSCISEETAYRIGYDIGSSLSHEGETLRPNDK